LLREALALLEPRGDGALLIDGTLGEGGHSAAFMDRFPSLRVTGVDRDAVMAAKAKERLATYAGRITFAVSHTRDFLTTYKGEAPEVILLDLGVSLFHYEMSGRGFSFLQDEPLDMRLDLDGGTSARTIIAQYREEELADMLYYNGGERRSRRIARLICEERKKSAIVTTRRLADIVHRAIGARNGKIDGATRTFAALRIEVNEELSALEALLTAAFTCLKPGGRLGVISFHSAEDRIVKRAFKNFAQNEPIMKGRLITKKPVAPSDDEIAENPPSRSAKLRVVEKVNG
jgi:16S rRNA (cytosine1402-N4)-methyltransferase